MARRYLSYFEFQDFLIQKGDSLVMNFDPKIPIVFKHSTCNISPQDLNVENLINKKYPDAFIITGKADDTRMVAFKYFFDDPMESKMQKLRKG